MKTNSDKHETLTQKVKKRNLGNNKNRYYNILKQDIRKLIPKLEGKKHDFNLHGRLYGACTWRSKLG